MTTEQAAQPPFQHLTVIGTGLIGGSLLMAAREAFPELHIRAVDQDENTLQFMSKPNVANAVMRELPSQWEENHLIVLANHLNASYEFLSRLAPQVEGLDITLSDVGSCKRRIFEIGRQMLPEQFIAGHPMAGREFSGVSSATSLLFAGKSWLFCPHAGVKQARFERLQAFVEGLRGIPRTVTPDDHDRYMAYVSHLPQLYSVLLTNLIDRHEPGHLLSYHGGGIDDQLRLAASPHTMWGEVFAENADNLRAVAREMGVMLGEMDDILDAPKLALWFERSNRLHQDFVSLKQNPDKFPTNQVL